MSNTQGICAFVSPSLATAPEDVIPKVEPRLLGFKLREILKIIQNNEIKLKRRWYVIKGTGKSNKITITELHDI